MGYGLAALSGILGGLAGLPRGMAEATAADQRQQQIDEAVRARQVQEQTAQTDLGQLSQMLGIELPGVQPGMRVSNATANLVAGKALANQTKTAEQARMDALRNQLPEAVRPYFGVPGGAELYRAQAPRRPKIEMRAGAGDTYAITTDPETGEPIGPPRPLGIGATESRALVTPQRVEQVLRDEGLQPGTPQWNRRYLEYAQPATAVPEVGVFTKPQVVGSPPPAAINPRVPLGQQPTVQAAGGALAEALGNMNAAARGLPGVPSGAPPARTAGAVGGPQPSLAFPKKPLSPDDAGALGVPYGTTKEQAYGATPLTAGQRTKMDAQASVLAMVDKMEQDLKGVALPRSPLGRALGAPKAIWNVAGQGDPKLAAFHRRLEGTLALIVRALGEVGALTDKDIERARSLQPVVYPLPDRAEVVAEKLKGLRELVQEVAARTGGRPETLGQPNPAVPAATSRAPGGPRRLRFNQATGLLE